MRSHGRPPRGQSVPVLHVRSGPCHPPPGRAREARMNTRTAIVRHRRPSGEPPPLPAEPDTRWWLWFTAVVVLAGLFVKLLLRNEQPFAAAGNDVLRWFASHRGDVIVDIAKALNVLTWVAIVFAIRLAIVAVLGF